MKKITFFFLLSSLPALLHAEPASQLNSRIIDMQRQTEAALRAQTEPGAVYRLTKSLIWLDLALDELHEDDRSGIAEEAVFEAARLASGSGDAFDTPILSGSERIREDLWQKSAQLKQHKDSDCAMPELAKLDVQLLWAGHEKWESGWTHARPYVEVAENLAYEAEQAIARCSTATVEKFIFSTDVLFQFDRGSVEQMSAGMLKKLATVADRLKTWKSIEQIEVIGHTDRLGDDAYNDLLSGKRAENVRDYLISRGLPAKKISAIGRGETDPIVECLEEKQANELRACLQPNRRVEITVRGEK